MKAKTTADKGWGKEEVTGIWNSFADTPEFSDCHEQKCFRNRNYGVERIWKAIQRLSQPVTAHGNGHKPIVVAASDSTATEATETANLGAPAAQVAPNAPETGETTSQPAEAPLSAEPVGDGKQIEEYPKSATRKPPPRRRRLPSRRRSPR